MNPRNLTLILACVFIVAGITAFSWRAGLIAAGLLLVALVFTSQWENE